MEKDMLTTTQAHQLTGLSMNQLAYLCKHHRIEAEKVGRDWVMNRRSLLDYVSIWHPEIARKIEEGSASQ